MLTDFPLRYVPRLAGRTAFLFRSQRWSREQIGRHADRQLVRLVRHAARHVPYYRDLFARIGLDAAQFRGRADLERIPLLDKETLRRRAEEFVADDAERDDPRWTRTSGSTGTPLRFMLGAESRITDAAATLRAYQWAGFVPGMKVFTLKWFMRDWEMRSSFLGRSINADTMRLDADSAERMARAVNRLRPAFFHGYASAFILLHRLAADRGIVLHPPRVIITIGQTVPPAMRTRLQALYGGARISDHYGLTENSALITECRQGTKHVLDDYAWHEFVDEDGRPVESGRAEIVGTSYDNQCMPLIRYRTRDYAMLDDGAAPCACGRAFRSVVAIEGRKEDVLQTPEGRLINLFEEPLNEARGVMAAQYVQEALDRLVVRVIPADDFDPDSLTAVEQQLRVRVGPSMRIDFQVVRELERRHGESGKYPFLISRIGPAIARPEDYEAIQPTEPRTKSTSAPGE